MENATITALTAQFPLVEDLMALKETTWLNPRTTSACRRVALCQADQSRRGRQRMRASTASRRIWRKSLPETAATGGIIESKAGCYSGHEKKTAGEENLARLFPERCC